MSEYKLIEKEYAEIQNQKQTELKSLISSLIGDESKSQAQTKVIIEHQKKADELKNRAIEIIKKAVGCVPLVRHRLVPHAFELTRAALDRTLDVVLRHRRVRVPSGPSSAASGWRRCHRRPSGPRPRSGGRAARRAFPSARRPHPSGA